MAIFVHGMQKISIPSYLFSFNSWQPIAQKRKAWQITNMNPIKANDEDWILRSKAFFSTQHFWHLKAKLPFTWNRVLSPSLISKNYAASCTKFHKFAPFVLQQNWGTFLLVICQFPLLITIYTPQIHAGCKLRIYGWRAVNCSGWNFEWQIKLAHFVLITSWISLSFLHFLLYKAPLKVF